MLLWADGFDHYGTTPNGGRTNMLAGAWAAITYNTIGSLIEISSTRARTGSYSLKIQHGAAAVSQVRRVIGSARNVVGMAFAVHMDSLPSSSNQHGFEIRNPSNDNIVRLCYQSDGSIGVRIGSAATLIGTTDPVLLAGSFNHIEVKVTIDNIVGDIEINVNGTQVFVVTDLALGLVGASQAMWGSFASGASSFTHYLDDLVNWDDDGAVNNTFLGQQRVHTIFPVADTTVADWVPVGAASGFDCINEVPPDGDTTYIAALEVDEIIEFELDTLPPETETIAGVYVPTMGRLAEAGLGSVRTSLVSGVSASDGPSQAFSATYAYYGSVHQVDPATDIAWTKSGLEAALLRLTKTV